MASETDTSKFESGRANLRETAKWIISGMVGAAVLVVGSSTFSQLGSMEPTSWRLLLALAALLIAIGLGWFPLRRGVNVLRSELFSLYDFGNATTGELRDVAKEIESRFGRELDGKKTLGEFVAGYAEARKTAWNDAYKQGANETPAETHARAQGAIDALELRFDTLREACISQLVLNRFNRLIASIICPGLLVLLAFLVFAWAANPSKDAVKILDKPYSESLTPENKAKLETMTGIEPACHTNAAQLIFVAASDAGPQSAILIGPGCGPHKVTLSADHIVLVD